jgi:hypothetical protein
VRGEAPPQESRRSALASTVLVATCVLAGVALGLWPLVPPAPVPKSAPPTEFSSERALEQLREISREPHAMGWPHHERVREDLLRRLGELGLEILRREATAVESSTSQGQPVAMGRVRNVLARLPGREARAKALLLAAHYDSMPDALGTSDDGFGVAALLETARALKAGPPPRQDILFLFTDGEEPGLLGAHAFVQEDPLRSRVGLVLNFEARGNRGPALAFQTSPGNDWLISQVAQVPHPAAASLSQAVYSLLPNDTDLSEFLTQGLPGLNFANIQGSGHYHSMTDSLEAADERTLQHHGAYALGLARRFSELELVPPPGSRDAIFFNAGKLLVHYPASLGLPAAVLLVLAFVGVVARHRTVLSGKLLLVGAAAPLALVLAAAAIAFALDWLTQGLSSGHPLIDANTAVPSTLASWGTFVVALALTVFVGSRFLRRWPAAPLTAGALLPWLAMTVALTLSLPAASYLFQLPLLCAVISLAVNLRSGPHVAASWQRWVLAGVTIPAVMLMTSHGVLLDAALESPLPSAVLAALLAGVNLPQLALLLGAWRRLPVTLAALGIVALVLAVIHGRMDGDQQRPNRIFYALDGDDGKASWLTPDDASDTWAGAFFQGAQSLEAARFFPLLSGERFPGRPAPLAPVPLAEAVVLEDRRESNTRVLTLQLRGAGAPVLELYSGPESRIQEASIDGKPVRLKGNGALSVRYWALPEEGVRVTLKAGMSTVSLRLMTWRPGVPELPPGEDSPRWDGFHGGQRTVSSRTVTF